MVQENLQEHRPSRNEEFAARVLAFINAADFGYADEVKTMLAEQPDLVDVKGKARYSTRNVRALHYALNYGHIDVVEQLIEAGADINAQADEEWSPIHYALRGAHPELAQRLIKAGATIDLYAAAGLGDLARVQTLVDENPQLVHEPGPGGATALHFATTPPVARFLLAQRADVNVQDDRGRTPLAWNPDKPDVVELLLKAGAEVADIFLACALGHVETVTQLLADDPSLVHMHKDPRTGTLLHVAANHGHVAVAKVLLAHGAQVNVSTEPGAITPMHDAAFSGHVAMVEFLLTHGADADARDTEFGATPLAWARFNGQEDVVSVLNSI